MKIIGIDPSLSATGIVVLDENGSLLDAHAIKPKKLRGMPRLKLIRNHIKELIVREDPELILIEGYSFGSRGRSIFNLGELGGVLRLLFEDLELQYIDVPPTVLKKWVTGKGNADKEMMLASIEAKYGIKFDDDNIGDAFGLAKMGFELGQPEVKKRCKKDS